MDDVTWGILAIALTGAGGAATWWQFKEHGPVQGARALGWTLLVPAAWLTGVLALFARLTSAFGTWASRLAFSPTFWVGIVIGGLGISLIAITGLMARRGLELRPADGTGATPGPGSPPNAPRTGEPRTVGPRTAPTPTSKTKRSRQAPSADDEFGDIEAMLRKRGIE